MLKKYVFIFEWTVHVDASVGVFVVVADKKGLYEVFLVLGVVVVHDFLDDRLKTVDELLEVDCVWVVEYWGEGTVRNGSSFPSEVGTDLIT